MSVKLNNVYVDPNVSMSVACHSVASAKVWAYIQDRTNKGGYVSLSYRLMRERARIAKDSYFKAIAFLKSLGTIVKHDERSSYLVNPYHVYKGAFSEIHTRRHYFMKRWEDAIQERNEKEYAREKLRAKQNPKLTIVPKDQ